MTSRERILQALRGESLLPRPVGAVTQSATVELMEAAGAAWPREVFLVTIEAAWERRLA